jgi:hypothetical protein
MTGKRAEGMASGESKRAMAAGADGILRTGEIYPFLSTVLLSSDLIIYLWLRMCLGYLNFKNYGYYRKSTKSKNH